MLAILTEKIHIAMFRHKNHLVIQDYPSLMSVTFESFSDEALCASLPVTIPYLMNINIWRDQIL